MSFSQGLIDFVNIYKNIILKIHELLTMFNFDFVNLYKNPHKT